jgi:hypothetical protein
VEGSRWPWRWLSRVALAPRPRARPAAPLINARVQISPLPPRSDDARAYRPWSAARVPAVREPLHGCRARRVRPRGPQPALVPHTRPQQEPAACGRATPTSRPTLMTWRNFPSSRGGVEASRWPWRWLSRIALAPRPRARPGAPPTDVRVQISPLAPRSGHARVSRP